MTKPITLFLQVGALLKKNMRVNPNGSLRSKNIRTDDMIHKQV